MRAGIRQDLGKVGVLVIEGYVSRVGRDQVAHNIGHGGGTEESLHYVRGCGGKCGGRHCGDVVLRASVKGDTECAIGGNRRSRLCPSVATDMPPI